MKKLDIEGIAQIQSFAAMANYEEYNSNIVTMFMWDHVYEVFYEVHEHFILILVNYHHRYGWMMPLCDEKYLKEAFNEMDAYSKSHHLAYEIHGMNQRLKDYCEENKIPFVYHNDINAQDYVYDIEMQRSLSGKKMQKRRNHFNAFLKEYENRFEYEDLKKSDEEEIFTFLEDWKSHHSDPVSIENEMIGIRRLFELYDELHIMGGLIRIDGKIKAFCMLSSLSERMIQMHVEKADPTIRGLYVAILKYALMHIDPKYTLLNREDDLGLESLRTAKSNLHPIYKIKKYLAYQGSTHIEKAKQEHLPQIQKLWHESFPDENKTTTAFFFEHLYHPNNTYLLMHDAKILCMMQMRTLTIMKDLQKVECGFIVGVATNPYYQGCGYMKQLMHYVLENSSFPFVCIQAYNWDLYRPFGFSEAYTCLLSHFIKQGESHGERCDDAKHLLHLYESFVKNKDGYCIRDIDYYENYLIPYTKLDSEIWANEHAYIIVNKEHTLVSECIYEDQDSLIDLLNIFEEIDVKADIPLGEHQIINSMMVRGDFNRTSSLFISETL